MLSSSSSSAGVRQHRPDRRLNPIVFLDVSVGDGPAGRLLIEVRMLLVTHATHLLSLFFTPTNSPRRPASRRRGAKNLRELPAALHRRDAERSLGQAATILELVRIDNAFSGVVAPSPNGKCCLQPDPPCRKGQVLPVGGLPGACCQTERVSDELMFEEQQHSNGGEVVPCPAESRWNGWREHVRPARR